LRSRWFIRSRRGSTSSSPEPGSGIAEEFRKTSRYKRNIRIENNRFRVFSPLPLLSIFSVDGLTFVGNHLERTTDYPAPAGRLAQLFEITDSDRVTVEEPHMDHPGEAPDPRNE